MYNINHIFLDYMNTLLETIHWWWVWREIGSWFFYYYHFI